MYFLKTVFLKKVQFCPVTSCLGKTRVFTINISNTSPGKKTQGVVEQ